MMIMIKFFYIVFVKTAHFKKLGEVFTTKDKNCNPLTKIIA